ncbi:hypothetical protein Marpi_1182 [Marinitoga piezophila KA3]|uniref:O-Antigen ligase n=1 Tax=Marinitoga piezophila (strain DSM 14283 / JCM 11233 / KA3) TaxID=443254 RepID=H2J8A7_MARPK|nr:hypothetical protein [Marinitoga piezophila]AEX85591.1 hypothetical protein Marpi_1182 [Marinitoga piezophila KA3]
MKLRNLIFKIGIFFIAFDNLFFAPSNGWAAISPIIFFIYIILDYKSLVISLFNNLKIFSIIYFMILYTFLNDIFYNVDVGNLLDSIISLILGFAFYLSLYDRYILKKYSLKRDLKILIMGYSFSLMYGILKYIALRFQIIYIIKFQEIFEKRYYPRVSFGFTEPSFISPHVFGILLILFFSLDGKYYKNEKKRILYLISFYVIITFVSKSSTRFFVDLFFISIILLITKINIKKSYNIILMFIFLALIMFFYSDLENVLTYNLRIKKIIDYGIYADASLASRYFRINSSIKGYLQDPLIALIGKGTGNSSYFLKKGYLGAYQEYKNEYLNEILALKYRNPNQLFSMPIRLISEFGIIFFLILFFNLFVKSLKSRKITIFLIMSYIYIQFDSYAFYSFWIYLFILKYDKFFNKQKIECKF